MTKCAQCHEDKPESAFSKSQLKKGNEAKCATCCADATTASATSPSSPTPKIKVCSQCKRSDRQFSKAQLKKDDGRCMECVQSAESGTGAGSGVSGSSSPPDIKLPEASKRSDQVKAAGSGSPRPKDEDEDDGIRVCCRSCQVFKPQKSFRDADNGFCVVCADAKKKGIRQTTMQDHGLVASDGTSYRKLSWVPENLKEYLAFLEEEANSGGARGGHDHDEDDGHGEYYEDDE